MLVLLSYYNSSDSNLRASSLLADLWLVGRITGPRTRKYPASFKIMFHLRVFLFASVFWLAFAGYRKCCSYLQDSLLNLGSW